MCPIRFPSTLPPYSRKPSPFGANMSICAKRVSRGVHNIAFSLSPDRFRAFDLFFLGFLADFCQTMNQKRCEAATEGHLCQRNKDLCWGAVSHHVSSAFVTLQKATPLGGPPPGGSSTERLSCPALNNTRTTEFCTSSNPSLP